MYDECHPFNDECLMGKRVAELGSEICKPIETDDHSNTNVNVLKVHDTREKLEADAQKFSQMYYTSHLLVYDKVIELLDRQAAITERETKLRELYRFENNHRWHIDSIEEVNRKLNERIEELNDENEHIRSQLDAIISSEKVNDKSR